MDRPNAIIAIRRLKELLPKLEDLAKRQRIFDTLTEEQQRMQTRDGVDGVYPAWNEEYFVDYVDPVETDAISFTLFHDGDELTNLEKVCISEEIFGNHLDDGSQKWFIASTTLNGHGLEVIARKVIILGNKS